MALLSWLSLALFGDRHVWRYSGWCRVKAFITRHAVTHALTDGHKLMKNTPNVCRPYWRRLLSIVCLTFLGLSMSSPTPAQPVLLEDFGMGAQGRWEYIADTVMGGVSEGRVQFVTVDDQTVLKLSGTVSTKKNGGFIQARLPLAQALPESAQGIWLKVRGNNQPYFVHLRTAGTLLPWQYYQAKFEASDSWQVVRLPWSAFEASEGFSSLLLRETPLAGKIKSIAIVAFGRDHQADVEVAEIGYE